MNSLKDSLVKSSYNLLINIFADFNEFSEFFKIFTEKKSDLDDLDDLNVKSFTGCFYGLISYLKTVLES